METIKLSSGYEMPKIGLGTWQSNPHEVGQAVKAAIRAGYRLIDCALVYENEYEIGAALKELIEAKEVKREDLFIGSKLWNTHHNPEDVVPALRQSLSDLGVDYLDLYLIHYPMSYKRVQKNRPNDAAGNPVYSDVELARLRQGRSKSWTDDQELRPKDAAGNPLYDDVDHIKTWTAMEACVDEGLVRSIGLSNFNSQQIQRVVDSCRIRPAVLQIELHPYLQQWKLENFCRQRDIAVMAYSSFGSPGWSDRQTKFPSVSILADDRLVSIGKKYNKAAAQVILRWLYQRRVITIPKSVTPERIQQNIQIFDFELSAEDMNDIMALDRNIRFRGLYTRRDGKLKVTNMEAPNTRFSIEF